MDYDAQQSVEIVSGLILGSIFNLEEILYMKPDVLFPLDRLPGWRGARLALSVTEQG